MLYSIVTLSILMVMIGPVASGQTAGAIIRPDGMDEEQLKFISDVNQLRQKFAEKWKIQNMQMLIWSKELQNSIKEPKHPWNLTHYSTRNWRLMNLKDYKATFKESKGKWNEFTEDDVMKIGDSTKSNVYHHELELFNPNQSAIGCARHNLKHDLNVTCLIGFNGPLAAAPRYQSDQKCTSPLKEVDGLCTSGFGSNNVFKDSSELMFISVLNEKRREMAKRDNISNMYELNWYPNYKTKAEKFIKDLKIDTQSVPFRIAVFQTYSNGLEYCYQNCKNQTFETYYGPKEELTIGQEPFHPLQTRIACAKNSKKGNIMCLLGENPYYAKFVHGFPGSKCNKRYENKDGLCCKKEDPPAALPTPPTAPSTEVTVEPVQQSPPTTTQPPPKDSDDGTCPNTPPGPSQTRFTTEKVTPEPPPTHPPELADYEEIDGDEYDEDFPTGSPPSQNVYWYNENDSRWGGGGLGRWILLLCLFVFLV
ncbi:hypothetical protein GCK72_003340 [Caenorhabditis remanei]|uniref:SCP domain-containing protein n=1 Tax=Caenorhabditis remanei TaxID=31234 RepID=A0A6A5HY28_CAERE|nr:hypothetical protein GCK72_003340 [Caenorhabditis remanei]KAF1771513.1 hypothetical protein GCK72_003340 [Caenorhabditis remanei]